jgi:hypothetical protein
MHLFINLFPHAHGTSRTPLSGDHCSVWIHNRTYDAAMTSVSQRTIRRSMSVYLVVSVLHSERIHLNIILYWEYVQKTFSLNIICTKLHKNISHFMNDETCSEWYWVEWKTLHATNLTDTNILLLIFYKYVSVWDNDYQILNWTQWVPADGCQTRSLVTTCGISMPLTSWVMEQWRLCRKVQNY